MFWSFCDFKGFQVLENQQQTNGNFWWPTHPVVDGLNKNRGLIAKNHKNGIFNKTRHTHTYLKNIQEWNMKDDTGIFGSQMRGSDSHCEW